MAGAGAPGIELHYLYLDGSGDVLSKRSAAADWLLRTRLATALGLSAEALDLERGPYGKPRCRQAVQAGLGFNLSHTGDRIVLALRSGGDVGIDLETLSHAGKALRVARQAYTPMECDRLARLPATAAEHQALCWWVMKEAIAKAVGLTVFHSLSGVDLAAGRPAIQRGAGLPAGPWRVIAGAFGTHHMLALALYAGAGLDGGSPLMIPVYETKESSGTAPAAIRQWEADFSWEISADSA
ncbi:4'-phosphopantetheinyl transferase family protein [Oleisolibacter albus]|uniref:4'-phosphopantetheinyl transferase family protein n=1 Tax=Oleisolibacter albus TaxID=2171757 RepID=UPI000DF281AA|nr:4'-phosphopantetheinyl transferase superfamily protein [Oleisolibacter albus]